jgi:hypothetical protein
MTISSEHENEPLYSMKGGHFQFLKEGFSINLDKFMKSRL